VTHQTTWSWYTGRWWVGCYIWYTEETGRSRSSSRPLFAVPNVTAYPSTASVPITVWLYNGLLLRSFNVAIKSWREGTPSKAWFPSSDSVTQRTAPHRNSAGTPPALAENTTRFSLLTERRRHAAGCRKLLRYRLFSRRFFEWKTLAVRCVSLRDTHRWKLRARQHPE